LLVALITLIVITQTTYMNVAALLPAFTKEHFPGLSSAMNGILLAGYQVTYFISTPLVGKYCASIGRKNCIGYGVVVLSMSTATFGLAALSTDQWLFWSISFFARCLQGFGDGMCYIPLISLLTLEFPEKNEVYQGYGMMALGIGYSSGPALAAISIRWCGYLGTNMFFASLILTIGAVGTVSMPERINKAPPKSENVTVEGESHSVSYFEFFKN